MNQNFTAGKYSVHPDDMLKFGNCFRNCDSEKTVGVVVNSSINMSEWSRDQRTQSQKDLQSLTDHLHQSRGTLDILRSIIHFRKAKSQKGLFQKDLWSSLFRMVWLPVKSTQKKHKSLENCFSAFWLRSNVVWWRWSRSVMSDSLWPHGL